MTDMRGYELDFFGWTQDTATAISEGRWDEIDRIALADEIASLGKRERRDFVHRLAMLLYRLLKARYQPSGASRGWELATLIQREDIVDRLGESPSLRPMLGDLTMKAYELARYYIAIDTGISLGTFPEESPFTDDEIWGGAESAAATMRKVTQPSLIQAFLQQLRATVRLRADYKKALLELIEASQIKRSVAEDDLGQDLEEDIDTLLERMADASRIEVQITEVDAAKILEQQAYGRDE